MLGIADAGTAMPLHNAAMTLIARAFMKRVGYPRTSRQSVLCCASADMTERCRSLGKTATIPPKDSRCSPLRPIYRTMQDLNDLYYFVSVVDHGGFAAAGRALGLQKSK